MENPLIQLRTTFPRGNIIAKAKQRKIHKIIYYKPKDDEDINDFIYEINNRKKNSVMCINKLKFYSATKSKKKKKSRSEENSTLTRLVQMIVLIDGTFYMETIIR